ncbi:tetratricopeptide repeat-containing glycosyltransferase family 2 protein [Clostridium isatidis]|uniref:tetratricopeptide repeat-containing glycosyltransferase family 2 protein n=1 Tax=Clostridium isatidis TaxID=182773 RepID=UPI003AAB8699
MISLCMIVKNEENNISKCFESLNEVISEIVVVDTGSTDATKNIVLKYTNRLYDYKWENDFSKARNYCIEKAKNDWILVLDADEVIVDFNQNKIKDFILFKEDTIGRINIVNVFNDNNFVKKYSARVGRLFNRKNYIFEGKVHEQLVKKGLKDIQTDDVDIVIEHYGYDKKLFDIDKKLKRNIDLLKYEINNRKHDAYLYYQLGKSYYMAAEFKNSALEFEKAIKYINKFDYDYVEDLIETYGYALINTGDYKKALDVLQYEKYFENSSDFIFLQALVFMNNGLFDMAVNSFKKATCFKTSKMEGVNSYLAYYNLGVIYECLGMLSEAIYYYNLCGDFNMAKNRLNNLIANNEVI